MVSYFHLNSDVSAPSPMGLVKNHLESVREKATRYARRAVGSECRLTLESAVMVMQVEQTLEELYDQMETLFGT